MRLDKSLLCIGITLALSACGGSDSGGTDNSGGTNNDDGYAFCSVEDQNQRFFEYMKDDYFWADQLQDSLDPEAFDDVYAVLEELRVPEDRYSYILTEEEYDQLFVSATYFGFGFSMEQISESRVKFRFVYDDSPADTAGIDRADELIAIEGVAVSELLANGEFNDALGPNEEGLSREITWQKPDGTEQTEVLSKVEVETNTVMGAQTYQLDGETVGYFTLDSFINRTGDDLNNAFDLFAAEGINHLVIDVRYNGGGLIRYANQVATQAAGINVQGETFLEYRFNEQNSSNNQSIDFSLVDGVEQLDLDRVFVLTTGSSCSSSEIIINSLSPHIEVVTVGEPTCGKPVGQQPEELCDKVTFAINFETVNSEGEGKYYDGIAPNCSVEDEIVGDWGSTEDPLTAAANTYISSGSCPAASASAETKKSAQKRSFVTPIYNMKDKRESIQ
ncbi:MULTISPECIES: S41 family peptidase [Idiomarina]|uniref:S41 family peptidase n=1 Tax=Idiomarina TaxID=135575 RepID=UPI000C550DE2|nr:MULTISPECIES: S41 family peptidase [Idiomarina]MAO67708.1 peptidase S41 [Idiomarina sp.]MBF79418.1 peptidase S41 [Idiomarina sp.]|tara:strand:+ start:218 stop:1558 length:1341 start_codon:yes stop_codon:yes gene_type:complete